MSNKMTEQEEDPIIIGFRELEIKDTVDNIISDDEMDAFMDYIVIEFNYSRMFEQVQDLAKQFKNR